MKPIKPSEVVDAKQKAIPAEMFEAVNELIIQKWDGYNARFQQKELLSLYSRKKRKAGDGRNGTVIRQEAFDKHYMDFEDIYRQEGWYVDYDKPGYNENYEATFEFKKKK